MLLDIVRERTGYPPEVLRLELDLEAELGIDSIKRVEILGKLRDAFPQLGNASDPEAMDRLVSARTLAAIVDRVERAIGSAGAAAAPNPNPPASTPTEPAAAGGTRNGKVHGGARRLLLEAVEAPLGGAESGLMTGGTVLITEDDRGIAEALAGAIRSRGWQAAIDRRPGFAIGLDISRRGGQGDSTGATRWAVRGIGPSPAAPIGPHSRDRRGRLGRPDEPRGPGALPDGEGDGRRPRARPSAAEPA